MEDILKTLVVGNKRKRNRAPSRKSSPDSTKTAGASVQSSSFVMGSSPTLPFLENRTEDSRESMVFTETVDERTLFNELLHDEPDIFKDGKLLSSKLRTCDASASADYECANDFMCYETPRGTRLCLCPHHLPLVISTSRASTTDHRCDLDGHKTRHGDNPMLPLPVVPQSNLPVLFMGTALLIIGFFLLASVLLFVRRKLPHNRRCRDIMNCQVDTGFPLTRSHSLNKGIQYVTNPAYHPTQMESFKRVPIDVEIAPENVAFLEVIGEGCFGKVHRALYTTREGSSLNVAVKVLKDVASPEAMADFEREVLIMANFSHPNILKLIGVVYKETDSVPWMVFEFMQYGDLAELLRANAYNRTEVSKTPFMRISKEDLPNIATQIASGMLYLSTQHFVHRDLATRNCLVGDGLSVKISDFGMSRDVYTCDYYKIGGSRMLPVRWMAPESIMYGKFTLESDIWSYGVVLWETFTFGKQPYYGHSNEEVVKLILQGILLTPPESCPAYVYSIMAGCWKTDPLDRLSFEDICKLLLRETETTPTKFKSAQLSLDMDDYLLPKCATSEL